MTATRIDDAAPALRRGLLLAGIVLIAFNLRPVLAAVGPVVDDIRAATGLSSSALGLLTTLPLLAFGVVSTFTPFVTRKVGLEGALALALGLLGLGAAARSVPSLLPLFGGTVLLGIGIALGNVLMPALVKRDFPERSGFMTSLYSSIMAVGATVAAGVSVPLAAAVGWRGALGLWAVPALLALLVWLPQLSRRDRIVRPIRRLGPALRSLGRSRLAWQVALFMGLQSLTFYVILAWLPDLLQDRGMAPAEAGWMLALSQATGILGSATVPVWAGRRSDQRSVVWLLGGLEAVSLLGLVLTAGAGLVALWVSILGLVLGGTFGLSLLLLVVRASDTETATELSGMAQSVGYLVAAGGPALFGLLHDTTGGWRIPLVFLGLVLAGKLWVGIGAGSPGEVRHGTGT